MEQLHSARATRYVVEEEELTMLDVMVTLAENIKLLIIGPLLVGLCVLGVCYALPQTFDSVAVLQGRDKVANDEASTAALMTTAAVLDPVAAELGLTKSEPADEARRQLLGQVRVFVDRNQRILTLTASARTPQQAQVLANAVLQQTYLQSRPKASERSRLEAQLQEAQERFKGARDAAAHVLKRMDMTNGAGDSTNQARGYADLLTVAADAQKQVGDLQVQLEGVSDAQLVQAPTLPQKASKPRKALLAIGAALAAGLALLVFVFMRESLRSAVQDADGASKLVRIRRALGLHQKP
jgi:uncharacterized protein involved in exopolysaccharide biosynthesis